MIDIKVKKHDNFSVEFKFGFVVDNEADVNSFAVNTWLFVPNSMGISPEIYGKELFYRDIKSNVRLITPVYSLHELALDSSLPYIFLKESVSDVENGGPCNDFEYHLKMYAAIIKSAVRNETIKIMFCKDTDAAKANVCECVADIESVLCRFRGLSAGLNYMPERERRCFLAVDEYINYILQRYLLRIVKLYDSLDNSELYASRQKIFALVCSIRDYSASRGYGLIDDNPVHNRDLVYYRGLLKKYIESDLYIGLSKRRDGVAVEQLCYSIAAGVAMIFATAVGWIFQVKFGNITFPLFIVLVISYMLKDRIKDLMRFYFAHRLGNKYFDKRASINIGNNKVGEIKEAVDFISGSKIDSFVAKIREGMSFMDNESKVLEEKVLLYRKLIVIGKNDFTCGNYYPFKGINEIMRLHIGRFMQKIDNPEVFIDSIDDTGHVSAIAVQRIYYIHIVMQLRHIDRVELRHFRVGFNRNGIVRVEEASLG